MSYYDNQQWPAAAGGQTTWENQTPPARSGASSAVPREDPTAFASQIEEVDRAIENLFKSGKAFPTPGRRESMPMGGRGGFEGQYGATPRHHSVSEFPGDARTYSPSNLQSFYATQRHSHGHTPNRASEAEQVMQAKRRMAAQRERELRNYHQEQQYNRSVLAEISSFGPTGNGKPDAAGARSLSPSVAGAGMTEEERRELIARQRSALYGEGGNFPEGSYVDENGVVRQAAPRTGHSPLAFDAQKGLDAAQAQIQQQQQDNADRANSASSPSSNSAANFQTFDNVAQQSSRTSTSSPGGSPPRQGGKTTTAPIGTRPATQTAGINNSNKRSTTPGLPSPLSFGFAAGDNKEAPANGKATDSNAQGQATEGQQQQNSNLNGWGNNKGVWGNNKLGVQASVWG